MNITHKIVIWGALVLVIGLLYACPTDSGDSTPMPTLKAEDITYDKYRIAQGTAGIATPSSSTITDFSILKFSLKSISTHTGTQVLPAIDKEDGTITVATDTSAGSYRVTITPDGSTFSGTLTVDFYVTIKATDIRDLDTKLQQAVTDYGLTGDFNYIDTSAVTDMSYLFRSGYTPGTGVADSTRASVEEFNGDISKWDVSAVTNFRSMFRGVTAFNQDIGEWIVKKGTNFAYMFYGATAFNQDIGRWDVSAGTDFSSMFYGATAFNKNIGKWTMTAGTDLSYMFAGATKFNQDISRWIVIAVTNFDGMFYGATAFNQDVGRWAVTAGQYFYRMFYGATAFNQDVANWNLNPATDTITEMFLNSGMTDLPFWYPQ